MKVVIIDYGAGNLFSVAKAFERLGVEPVISSKKEEISNADRVVFPGVGHAKTAMEQLQKKGLDVLIPELKQPVLGICLGMQLMCSFTEEGNVGGLRIFQERVMNLSSQVRNIANLQTCKLMSNEKFQIPHMGWNDVQFNQYSSPFYFVHSYCASIGPNTWGTTDYIQPFSAALKKDNFYGVQFHPEKSGQNGAEFLIQFLTNSFKDL